MPRWLLLAHQLPTRPSHARVRTWRRLQQLGALPARNSVYVLPNAGRSAEEFERLRGEIVSLGGDATVFAADVMSSDGDDDLIQLFRSARAADYASVVDESTRLLRQIGRRRRGTPASDHPFARRLGTLHERLRDIQAIDFFDAEGRGDAAEALARLQRHAAGNAEDAEPSHAPRLAAADFQRRRWVTRPRPGVDRMASAWLIRRFIDARATFGFVGQPEPSDVPFDMRDVDFGHHDTCCTFETIAHRFGVDDPAVVRLGRIVHDLDLHDARFGLPETAAVGQVVDRLRHLPIDDHALLEQGIAVFELLARSVSASHALAQPIGRRRTHRSAH